MKLPYTFRSDGRRPAAGRRLRGTYTRRTDGRRTRMADMPDDAGRKGKNFKNTMRTLMNYLKPYRFAIMLTLLFSIVGTVFAIIGPKLIGDATRAVSGRHD